MLSNFAEWCSVELAMSMEDNIKYIIKHLN